MDSTRMRRRLWLSRLSWLRWLACAWAMAAALLTLPAAAADAIVVRDDRGTEHRFATPPQRVITMLPSITETAWSLGIGSRLVGVDRYSNWPAAIRKLPHLGGLDDAQVETIAALKPDVVLASTASRSLDKLEALGLRVMRLKSETHADVHRTLELVARLLGTPAEAERVWARIDREISTAAARVPDKLRGQRVYFEIGGGPYAAGTNSFIGETLVRLGMGNAVPPELGPFPKLNPEYVIRAKPDIIMGVLREQQTVADRPGWGSLAAVRDKRMCGFETPQYEMLIRPSPRMGEAAGLLADCLVRLAKP